MSCRGIARPEFIASRGSTLQVARKLPFPKALLREPQPRAPPARPATEYYIHSYIQIINIPTHNYDSYIHITLNIIMLLFLVPSSPPPDESAPAERALRPTGTKSYSCQQFLQFQDTFELRSSEMYVSLEG